MPTNQVKPLDVNAMAQGMVTAMTFSVFGSAMGALMSGADYTKSPARTKFNDKGLAALTEQFGSAAVNAAKEKIGKKTDIVTLAKATEEVVLADLNTRYLPTEVATALAACPAGDYNCVKKVAATLHGNVPSSPEAMKANAATSASRFVKMRRAAVTVLDKKTNITYKSIASMGRALATEYGVPLFKADGSPDSFAGYVVLKKDPARFQEYRAI